MTDRIAVLREAQVHPVLMEVGAINEPPYEWRPIAKEADYIGIGPMAELWGGGRVEFRKRFIERAVAMPAHGRGFAKLHVSAEPAYSSVLSAHPGVNTRFLDLGSQGEKDVDFPSTTIDMVLATHSISGVDWLHARIPNSIELYESISEPVRKRVLAFDSVLILMDIWQEQGSTIERLSDLVRDGFWLSRIWPGGPIRIGEAARQQFAAMSPGIDEASLLKNHERSPAFVCIKMLRTVEALRDADGSAREYSLLWAFATLDRQFGFAADVLVAYERSFGPDARSRAMWDETVRLFHADNRRAFSFSLRGIAARCLPESVKRHLRPVVLGR